MALKSSWLDRARGLVPDRWLRDAKMVVDGLAGRSPPPFSSRPGGQSPSAPTASAVLAGARPMRVLTVTRETPDAVSLTLVDPRGEAITYRPGQFFTFAVRLGGEVLRRAYSASLPVEAATPAGSVRLTIKRVAGGRVSNHLVDHAAVGDTLDVFGPSGNFVVDTPAKTLVLLAGGSGVTPLHAIAMDVLTRHPETRIVFVVGNRSYEDIIFRDELTSLVERFPNQLSLRLVLSVPPEEWAGGVGILDAATTVRELGTLEGDVDAYVCGPTPMMDAGREALLSLGVAAERIREERFSSPTNAPATDRPRGDVAVTAVVGGKRYEVLNRSHETVLESALGAGVPMPYSCTMGGCGACRVKLLEGEMVMEEPNCLTPQERADGYMLICIGRATRAAVLESAP